MPEGPSIVILKEQAKQFEAKKIISISGNSKQPYDQLLGKKLKSIRSWGKHFLLCFDNCYVKIHFLLFGSYRINELKNAVPRLTLKFNNGFISFYACSVRIIHSVPDDDYDWSTDVMSDEWNPFSAELKLSVVPNALICDAILNQEIFAGAGNIIKNEVLYRMKVHPESVIRNIPLVKLRKLINDVRDYSFLFYEWKKKYVLKKHWKAHAKKICQRCNLNLVKKHTGIADRRSFFCSNCQVLYI